MSERENLYAAICAAPRDDLPKLVFADWLDEHGDATDRAHAELIRIQCEWEANARGNERALEPYRIEEGGELFLDAGKLAKVDPDAGSAAWMLNRAAELRRTTRSRSAMLERTVHGAKFRHSSPILGMKEEVRITTAPTWYGHWKEWSSAIPVRHLVLDAQPNRNESTTPAGQIEAAILPHLESLSSTRETVSRLFCDVIASPHLRHLRRLAPRHNAFQSGLLDALADAGHIDGLEDLDLVLRGSISGFTMRPERFRKLRRLSLYSLDVNHSVTPTVVEIADAANRNLEELVLNHLADGDAFARLAAGTADLFPRLVHLELRGSRVMGRRASDLLMSAELPALHRLEMRGNYLDGFVGRSLEKSEASPPLRSLGLGDCQLTPDGVAALARWAGLGNLRKLELHNNAMNHRAVAALTSAETPHLRTLSLANCELHGSHIRELVTSTFVRSLWSLDLRGNPFDAAAARALAESPFLDALQCLYLDLPEGDPNLPRLRERFGDRLQSGS